MDASDATPAAQAIASRVARISGQLTRAARRTRRREDEDAVHDTRVAVRRLEAVLDVWCDALRPRRWRRARRALRDVRRTLGPAREAEVSASLLRERLSKGLAAPAPDVLDVLARLERRRERARSRAARACRRETMDGVERRLRRVFRPLLAGSPVTDDLVAAVRHRIGLRATAARTTLADAAVSLDEDALHRARVTLKRWRYGLEALAGVDAGTAAAASELLEGAQGSLGALNDLAVLRATLEEYSRELESKGVRAQAPLTGLIAALESEFKQELEALPGRVATLARVPVVLEVARPGASSTRR